MTTATRDKLLETQSKQLAEFDREKELRDIIGATGAPPPRLLHFIPLYGREVSIHYGDTYNDPVSIDTAAEIAGRLPPEPMAYAEDRSYKYWVASNVGEDFKPDITTFFDIAPFYISMDGFGSKCHYFTTIDGTPCEVVIVIATGPHFGALSFTADYKRCVSGHVESISNKRVEHAGRNLRCTTLNLRDGDKWVGQFEQPVIYASGSHDYIGTCKLWAHMSSDEPVTIRAFLDTLHNRND